MRFEPGINCVVGPNGSGKSNVVDALAWVMGEQGAKNMRGGAMADVIFAGTSARQALGRAEVSLTIDNSDGALPIEYREVTISRTLFRSGGSEYAINGASCRLLDIQELLSDTGMGKEMHVIIGQGKLDEVLTSSAEDRRGFVEEAAGLLKHRKRKEKALRKLETMQGSLTRIEDLTVELRRQMGPLARQADAARKAGVIQAELRDAKARLLADDVAQQQARLQSHSADEQKIASQRAENARQVDEAKEQLESLELAAAQSRPETAHIAKQAEALGSLEERYRSLGELARERQRSLAQASGSEYRGERPQDIRDRSRRAREEEEKLEAAVREAADRLGSHVGAREQREERERQLDKDVAEFNRQLANNREETARHQGKIATIEARIEALDGELERVQAAARAAHDRGHEASNEAARIHEGMVEPQPPAEYEEATAHLDAAKDQLSQLRKAEQAAREKLASLRATEETLALSLEPEDATAWLMANSDARLLAGDLKVREGWESAFEAGLSGAAAGAVLDSHARATSLLARVHQASAGRVVMTVLGANSRSLRARCEELDELAERAIAECGAAAGAMCAVDAVEASPEIFEGIHPSLAGTVLASDLEAARALVDAGAPRVVTKAGDLLTAHLVAGGDEAASVLARRNRYDVVKREVVTEREKAENLREQIVSSEAEVKALSAQCHEFEAAAAVASAAHTKAQAQLKYSQQSEAAAQTEVARNEDRAAKIQKEIAARTKELAALQERGAPQASQDSGDRIATLQEELGAAHEATRSTRQQETEARLALRTAEERLRAVAGKSDALLRQAEAVQERIDRAKRAAERRVEAARMAEEVAEAAARSLAAVQSLRERVSRARAHKQETQDEYEAELRECRRRFDALGQEATRLADSKHQSELIQAEHRLKYEQLAAQASDELGMGPDELVEEYGPFLPVPTETGEVPYIRGEQEKRLAKAERGIARLGKINPLALEEHAALEERQRYLTDQLSDLKKSRNDLMDIVKDVDRHVHEVLSEALSDVTEKFSEVFSKLFPGGEGRLVLTEPDSPLTTGIEIEARPPGKRVKRLSLLSGGERSLTAFAFLVSIFMARPSPFYVMDEVEAALDDANLSRLLGVFRELQESSQLLVITHQKRTMEIADTLYGIAMQDSGVSSVISQRLADLGLTT